VRARSTSTKRRPSGPRCRECGRPTDAARGGEFLYLVPMPTGRQVEVWLCRRKACHDAYNGVKTPNARPDR